MDHENVIFLKLNSYDNISKLHQKELWDLLANREKVCESYQKNKLLWSLKFLKLTDDQDINDYAIYFKINHAIADAKISCFQILKLMEIIEKIYIGEYDRPEQYKTLPSYEDTFKGKYQTKEIPIKIVSPRKPKLFERPIKPSKKLDYQIMTKENLQILSVSSSKDEKLFIKFEKLGNIVKNTIQKTITIKVPEEKSKRLIADCKSRGLKLNGCLNALIILALKKLMSKHNLKESNDSIVYSNSVSLRPYLDQLILNDPKTSFETLGMLVNEIVLSIDASFDVNDDKRIKENFWNLVKRDSNELLRRLNNNEQYEWDDSLSEEFRSHFYLNNNGQFKDSLSNQKLIKLNESYLFMNTGDSICFVNAISIGNNLCLTINYDFENLSDSNAKLLVKYFNEIWDKVL